MTIIDTEGKLKTRWYRKSISSERCTNFHSSAPLHELINTYTQRFVICNRYDSGGGILKSYFMILIEMWNNSVPRRIIRVCINNSRRYNLGRCNENKKHWLTILSQYIYKLKLGTETTYEEFQNHLYRIFTSKNLNMNKLKFFDDTSKTVLKNHIKIKQKTPYYTGGPIFIFPYRGRQSIGFHNLLCRNYRRVCAVYRHDKYYSLRRLMQKGVKRHKTKTKTKPRQLLKNKNICN